MKTISISSNTPSCYNHSFLFQENKTMNLLSAKMDLQVIYNKLKVRGIIYKKFDINNKSKYGKSNLNIVKDEYF